MVKKHLIRPERVRKIPKRFSWIDHRLVREGHIESLSHSAAALYLFLVTVGDGQGLSFYSDASVGWRLGMDGDCLRSARDNLIRIGLIAYEYPLYQVLGFDLPRQSEPWREEDAPRKGGKPISLGEILKRAAEGANRGS